jgi:predicted transcriptional regulator
MKNQEMSKFKKFATQIDEKILNDLKKYAKDSDRSISGVVTEAVKTYLDRQRVRPAFTKAMDEVLKDHEELLRRLAK